MNRYVDLKSTNTVLLFLYNEGLRVDPMQLRLLSFSKSSSARRVRKDSRHLTFTVSSAVWLVLLSALARGASSHCAQQLRTKKIEIKAVLSMAPELNCANIIKETNYIRCEGGSEGFAKSAWAKVDKRAIGR